MATKSPQTIAVYTAIGTLTAAVLAYVFGPTFFRDDGNKSSSRAVGTVGLANPANDCFINSGLQALAGLPSIRHYLRARHFEAADHVADSRRSANSDRPVTVALRKLVDTLVEPQSTRRTVSAKDFIRILENVLNARLSRRQQDAQEFLQIVLDQLCEEHKSTKQAASDATPGALAAPPGVMEEGETDSIGSWQDVKASECDHVSDIDTVFPFQGQMNSIIQCQTCHFKPTPRVSSFTVLSLNVPQKTNVTIDECIDGLLKAETIDDYKCQRCCIQHALKQKSPRLASRQAELPVSTEPIYGEVSRLQAILDKGEEDLVEIDKLGKGDLPRSRISKYSTIAVYPPVLVLHLSRSIYDIGNSSRKNYAYLKYPEILRLGGFDRKLYKLMSLITHKGSHTSGHYETFRRQNHIPSIDADEAHRMPDSANDTGHINETDKLDQARRKQKRAQKQNSSAWWRVSDDRVVSAVTRDALAVNRDAYILFYELQSDFET